MVKFELKYPLSHEFRSTNDQFHVVERFGRDSQRFITFDLLSLSQKTGSTGGQTSTKNKEINRV